MRNLMCCVIVLVMSMYVSCLRSKTCVLRACHNLARVTLSRNTISSFWYLCVEGPGRPCPKRIKSGVKFMLVDDILLINCKIHCHMRGVSQHTRKTWEMDSHCLQREQRSLTPSLFHEWSRAIVGRTW